MEGIPHPHCDDGARKNDGWAIPFLFRVRWHRCVGSIVYIICFTVFGGSIWPPCSWISVPMWMTTTNWSMILWKIVTTFNDGGYWKCHFPTGASSLVCTEYPKNGLDSIVLLLAAWQRCIEVVRFRYLGGCVMTKHSFEDGATERHHVSPVWSLWMCVPLGNVFFTITSEMSMAFPRKSRREHLWVKRMWRCWRAIITT